MHDMGLLPTLSHRCLLSRPMAEKWHHQGLISSRARASLSLFHIYIRRPLLHVFAKADWPRRVSTVMLLADDGKGHTSDQQEHILTSQAIKNDSSWIICQ